MSTYVVPTGASDPFDALLRKAGAVFVRHQGRSVAVNYGSSAGELAVCVRAVGLVDRSHLTKLVLEAPAAQLRHLVSRLAGNSVAVGGAVLTGGAWWCGAAADRAVMVADSATGARMREQLLTQSVFHVSLTVRDCSEAWAAIALIGRSTPKVLSSLHAYGETGDPRRVAPFTAGTVDGVEVMWLLQSDHRALALVRREAAGTVWRAIEETGRPFGISCVGQEAASRYALLERSGR